MQTNSPRHWRRMTAVVLGAAALACAATVFAHGTTPHGADHAQMGAHQTSAPSANDTAAAAFATENDAAMTRMMAGMDIKPSGSIDQDFADMMIAHHQGAIDMALAELRHGSNVQLHRIAQEIIVEQQQEIAAMRLALGQPLPPSAPAPTQAGRQ